MLKNSIRTQLLLISTLVILVLSLFMIISGTRSFSYNRLSIEALALMDSWNNLERMKNDFLMNRSTINVTGEFDYKNNMKKWYESTFDFQRNFSAFLINSSRLRHFDADLSNLQDASIIWDSAYKSLLRIHKTLELIEKTGLDSLLFPELINNFYIYRMTDRIDFNDSILIMNLLNQFAFLDISSKEFSRLINSFVTELQLKHEINITSLAVTSGIILMLLVISICLMAFSFRRLNHLDRNIEDFQREEKYKALRRFIKGHENWENINNKFNFPELDVMNGAMVIPVLMKFNNHTATIDSYGPTEINNQLFQLSKKIEEELSKQILNCIVIPFEEGLAVFHILQGPLLSENEEERTFRLLDAIKQTLADYKELSFSFTYGEIHHFPNETQNSFREIYEASYYKLLFGYDTVISAEKIKPLDKIKSNYPIQLEKQITEYIKQGKIEHAKKTYTAIMDRLTSSNYMVIKNGINRLVIIITSALDTLEKFNNLGEMIDIIDFTRRIHSMETIEEINAAIFSLIDDIASELTEKKDNYKYFQISEVNKIIQRDYSKPNLSATVISEKIDLSTAYIGRIYKQHTGVSIQESINQKRMEAARDLLLKEKVTVAEICDAVGIMNNMYFYTLFKKYYGTTPKEYRQIISLRAGKI